MEHAKNLDPMIAPSIDYEMPGAAHNSESRPCSISAEPQMVDANARGDLPAFLRSWSFRRLTDIGESLRQQSLIPPGRLPAELPQAPTHQSRHVPLCGATKPNLKRAVLSHHSDPH